MLRGKKAPTPRVIHSISEAVVVAMLNSTISVTRLGYRSA
jgi:hypothetical protein